METKTSPFVTKKVVVPMNVWQFDETQVTPVPDNKSFLNLPEEVEQAFNDAGYSVIVVNAQQWDLNGNFDVVYKGQAIEATVTFRNNSRLNATVRHGQYIAFKANGEVAVLESEDVLS